MLPVVARCLNVMTHPDYPVAQLAYHVVDLERAAVRMHELFGAGPFFIVEDIALARATHRGETTDFLHSSAYGQWGDVMMELVIQTNDAPSPFRDLYGPDEAGLHHTATIVPDLEEAYTAYRNAGLEVACTAVTSTGTEFSFVDATREMGHFIEVYAASDVLLGFYDMVRTASQDWDGSGPVRYLNRT